MPSIDGYRSQFRSQRTILVSVAGSKEFLTITMLATFNKPTFAGGGEERYGDLEFYCMNTTYTKDWLRERVAQSPRLRRLQKRLDVMEAADLDQLAEEARATTRRHFGKTMRLFAPLYVSNECVNNCQYCGFSRDNDAILRVTLDPSEVDREADHLYREGFRNVLLVSGEHPKFVSPVYLRECVKRLRTRFPSVAIEVGPMEVEDYVPVVESGAEGLIVYQETYDREVYAAMHTAGPKRDFDWRLACPERGYQAGFRRIGIGVLLGLADWRWEALALGAHLEHLLRSCWKALLTISFPRLRPAAGEFQPLQEVSDRDYFQLLCAFRVVFPQVGIVLSTRESPAFRDLASGYGVTMMSAGSHTEPGGYTSQGTEKLHLTVRGRQKPVAPCYRNGRETAEGQFAIADERSPAEVADMLRRHGLDPVWKDWDQALMKS